MNRKRLKSVYLHQRNAQDRELMEKYWKKINKSRVTIIRKGGVYFGKKLMPNPEHVRIYRQINRDLIDRRVDFFMFTYLLSRSDKGNLYIIREYWPGTTLKNALNRRKLPQSRIIRILQMIILALIYFCDNDMVHFDLHAGNIMLEAGKTGRTAKTKKYFLDGRQFELNSRANIAIIDFETTAYLPANRGKILSAISEIFPIESRKIADFAADDPRLFSLDLWRITNSILPALPIGELRTFVYYLSQEAESNLREFVEQGPGGPQKKADFADKLVRYYHKLSFMHSVSRSADLDRV